VTATANTDHRGLANHIFRPDVTINSAVFTGNVRQLGNYTATGTLFGALLPRSGVVMSSGSVANVQQRGLLGDFFYGPGDHDLTSELKKIGLTGQDTFTCDAASLAVDVSVQKAVDIGIAYIFGSSEYFLSNQCADVFGLFHGGTNIALIGNDPVSVKTVNCGSNPPKNCNQFIGNAGRLGTSLSGYTKTLIATLKLPVGINQKVKIAIADVRHTDFDSAVFLSFRKARGGK
jgi:hypothetical protein